MKNLRLIPDFHKPHAIDKAEFASDKELIALVKSEKGKVKSTGSYKRVNPNTSRHSFATHLPEQGVSLRYRQTLLGHTSLKTTEIYPHVSKKSLANSMNPLDQLVEMQHADNKVIENSKTN
ncbi:MAG: tyrosine-type recombinase/integrase [Flavobacteriaceae bacterium]|nr:tyrosine-type recombinase/integrase [Flavobacteriaceae bacterium]